MTGVNAQNAINPGFWRVMSVIDAKGMAGFTTENKPLYPFTTSNFRGRV
jgi:hypothetical protein